MLNTLCNNNEAVCCPEVAQAQTKSPGSQLKSVGCGFLWVGRVTPFKKAKASDLFYWLEMSGFTCRLTL